MYSETNLNKQNDPTNKQISEMVLQQQEELMKSFFLDGHMLLQTGCCARCYAISAVLHSSASDLVGFDCIFELYILVVAASLRPKPR